MTATFITDAMANGGGYPRDLAEFAEWNRQESELESERDRALCKIENELHREVLEYPQDNERLFRIRIMVGQESAQYEDAVRRAAQEILRFEINTYGKPRYRK